MSKRNGGQLLVQCLEEQGVEYIFGIPGAKIDIVFDALLDSTIKLILCRHEQNAAFMAAAYGRITGKPGVVLVTSGPGVGNLVTGLLTATTEGDPVVAIGGNVPLAMSLKQSHQVTNNVKLMEAVTKSSVEIRAVDSIPEVIENAFRTALRPTCGASFISLPQDISMAITNVKPIPRLLQPYYGEAPVKAIEKAAEIINQAKQPVILLGLEASRAENTKAIRQLIKRIFIPVAGTFQAAGVLPRDDIELFIGRVGLFKNQPGDQILDLADVILTIGFNPVEYDPEIWNAKDNKVIIHLDYHSCNIHSTYHPQIELLGDIATNISQLGELLKPRQLEQQNKNILKVRENLKNKIDSGQRFNGAPIHPLRFIYELKQAIDEETTICCDIGSVYMWMARYFYSHRPHQLLFSNGQQTLGVALPWAIACNFARPKTKIVSISGDGGFLFSAMELETAVREKAQFVHFIWRDGTYNMVLEQEVMKYKRKSGVDFGTINIPAFAEAFGAIGWEMKDPGQFQAMYKEAMQTKKPVLIDVPIDYSDNKELFKTIDPHAGH
ncbi:acetolactate synthase (plasmid) [Legionella adelaidensis]|uniref:Acetolactate synthase n=1 Tax=Legionella adelaidensis TaxID=45056 RepID=A0A0W0R2W2_9GAMM|nr:acetolactate synthase AlsS [Legionella adelaidensis]KTC65411.1 acetolactate synthase [Legionella adelaidensis]VEH84767.1 acetolactate synthase [Legionella adelaidensis]